MNFMIATINPVTRRGFYLDKNMIDFLYRAHSSVVERFIDIEEA